MESSSARRLSLLGTLFIANGAAPGAWRPTGPGEPDLLAALAARRSRPAEGSGGSIDDWEARRDVTMDSRRGITLSRDQLEAWARRPLSDEEVEAIDDCLPNSSIPDAIEVIANEAIT